jgi:gamma-butyrobetaine dioxygenase
VTVSAAEAGVRAAELQEDLVTAVLADGSPLTLHTLALRDLCPCRQCRHPVSGQRLFESARVLSDSRANAVAVSERGALLLDWDDGHRSIFTPGELAEAAAPSPAAPQVALWDAERGAALPWHAWDAVATDAAALRAWLCDAAVLGFALLSGVPSEPGTVAEVAERFGAVRETNYGRVFDVRVSVDATNLADTSLPLSPHTDNPYRRPAPTLQLLHCLASGVEGGETVLVDGFAVVDRLRATSLRDLAVLAGTPIRYAYRDATADLAADVPLVTFGDGGSPVALHVNNRSKGAPTGPPELVAEWYAAYLALLALVEDPAQQLVFRLEPGNVVLFDNERVLHGRAGFTGRGTRHLQGCYADRDGLLSTLAVLER